MMTLRKSGAGGSKAEWRWKKNLIEMSRQLLRDQHAMTKVFKIVDDLLGKRFFP
jgi:hypothetical protein